MSSIIGFAKKQELVDNIQAKVTHNAFVLVKLCPQSLALQQAHDFTVVLGFGIIRALVAIYLSEPELSPHSPIQYGFKRVSIQMQCPLLLQGSSTHRRAILKCDLTICPVDIALIAHAQLQIARRGTPLTEADSRMLEGGLPMLDFCTLPTDRPLPVPSNTWYNGYV